MRRAVHFGGPGTALGIASPYSPNPITMVNANNPVGASQTIGSPYGTQVRMNPLTGGVRAVGQAPPEMVLQGDFRRVSGLTGDVFRQLEEVERMFDNIGLPADSVQRGEMLVRILDPRLLGAAGAEAGAKYLAEGSARPSLGPQSVQFIEILKRPGQTLGLYIGEGNGTSCSDGVFITRIALDSPVQSSGLLRVGDEILAVNLIDVGQMKLDDVVLLMSIPRRLLLTTRSYLAQQRMDQSGATVKHWQRNQFLRSSSETGGNTQQQPVVVLKSGGIEGAFDDLNQRSLDGSILAQQKRLLDGVANLVGGASTVELVGDEIVVDGHMVVYEDPYGRIGLRPREESGWIGNQSGRQSVLGGGGSSSGLSLIVNQQPRGLDASGRLQIARAHIHRPPSVLTLANEGLMSRSGSLSAAVNGMPLGSVGFGHAAALLSARGTGSAVGWVRGGRLLDAGVGGRLGLQPTLSDYYLERLQRPASRMSQLSTAAGAAAAALGRRRQMLAAGQAGAGGQLVQSMSTQGLATMLRRRTSLHGASGRSRAALAAYDASCSDSELALVQLPTRPASALGVPRAYPPMPLTSYEAGRASAMSLRSQSLPRPRHGALTDLRYAMNSSIGKKDGKPVFYDEINFDLNEF